MFLTNYLEQHENIKKETKAIDELLMKGDIKGNAFEISMHISRLAGIIKIHLSTEDKYLYPELIKNSDEKISSMAKKYQDEMGDIVNIFTAFKEKYFTKAKVEAGADTLEREYKNVIGQLSQRMRKEENELYKLI